MSEYTDITLINCNRSSSVEGRAGNNTNPAVFTNPLQQSVKLNVGDKVSVEKAFISEVGAGSPSTIEFKGNVKGNNIVGDYSIINKSQYYYQKTNSLDRNYRLGYYRRIDVGEIKGEEVDLKDNFAPIIIGYYITSNEYPNYIQQPRRFPRDIYSRDTYNVNTTYYTSRDREGMGFCRFTINPNMYATTDWVKRLSEGNINASDDNIPIYKQRVDNTRFTLYVKKLIIYSADVAMTDAEVRDMFPQDSVNGLFADCDYIRVREKVDLNINKGFNTPTAVANQLTQQLTETKKPIDFKILDKDFYEHTITKIIESTTYKPIDCQNLFNYNASTYDAFISGIVSGVSAVTQDKLDYISTFGYIGVKRPEIYEKGRALMNLLVPISTAVYENGIQLTDWLLTPTSGLQVLKEVVNDASPPIRHINPDYPIILNLEYTEENLDKLLAYFDTQALYPELWDGIEDSADYGRDVVDLTPAGSAYPSVNNSRFLHLNTMTSDTLSSPHNYYLGEDHFKIETGAENANKTSTIIYLAYFDSVRDRYIAPEDYDRRFDGFVKGFARPKRISYSETIGGEVEYKYYIEIDTRLRGGLSSSLFNETGLFGAPAILNRRRIGYDMHSSAYSTSIITPFSGYSDTDIGVEYESLLSAGSYRRQQNTSTSTRMGSVEDENDVIDLLPYKTMTYVGANNPAFDYNTTSNRFEIRKLHTANNIGNRLMAGCQLDAINSSTMVPKYEKKILPPSINQDGGDVVYKINPRPPQFGFSPTFYPYNRYNQGYRKGVYPLGATETYSDGTNSNLNTNNFEVQNLNIEPNEIFDAHGGIYIDNWGYSRENWEDNLWDILGFDYDAVAAKPNEKNVLINRINNDNSDALYRATTNAEIVSTDSKIYIGNLFGANMYYTSLPFPQNIVKYTENLRYTDPDGKKHYDWIKDGAFGTPLRYYPEISIKTQSTSIIATNIQKSVLKPYYTIRSSLIEGFTAIGGNPTGANLPIISIVDKYSAANDYFMGSSDLVFTITKPTMISDVITSIHDPDGEYSNIDRRSAVVYKIQTIKRTPQDIIQQILNPDKKEKKSKL